MKQDISNILSKNSYPGRGIIVGTSEDGSKAVFAYFIMGRSNNSRNRVFVEEDENVRIYPHDYSLVEDPSLIIYYPIRKYENNLVVTNGDQTDTIYEYLMNGKSFEESLRTRCFEPDFPNYTPRISSILTFENNTFTYKMSILKSIDGKEENCQRNFYEYKSIPNVGHFIHTYDSDGSPLPTFSTDPELINIPNDINLFAEDIWNNLNKDNKISLYVRYIDLITGETTNKMFNKHEGVINGK